MALIRKLVLGTVGSLVLGSGIAVAQEDTVRLRDIAIIGEAAPQRVMGYGLVVGLEGTGDQSWGGARDGDGGTPSVRSIMNLLRRFQVEISPNGLRLRNVAAVVVTGEIPAFSRGGGSFPVQVASIGDATSLAGGTLLMTPLLSEVGGEPVATAQGPLPILSEEISGQRRYASGRARFGPTRLGMPDAGRVLETTQLSTHSGRIPIRLKSPDPITALAIERRLREWAGDEAAAIVDPGLVEFMPPDSNVAGRIRWMATADTLSVEVPMAEAKVLWDARAGIVVAGGDIPIRPGVLQSREVQAEIPASSTEDPYTVSDLVKALQLAKVSSAEIGRTLQALVQANLLRATVVVL